MPWRGVAALALVGATATLLLIVIKRRRRHVRHRTGLLLPNDEPDPTFLPAADLAKDTTGCCGRLVWPAAEILCDFLQASSDSAWFNAVPRAIELGAGVGVPGLLAARLGVPSVTLTDYHPLVLHALRDTAAVNGLADVCSVASYSWADETNELAVERWPLVLGADLTWTTRGARQLATAARRVLEPEDGIFLYAHVERRAVYKGRDGSVRRESLDSALQALLEELLSDGAIACRELERRTFEGDDEPVLLLAFGGVAALERFGRTAGAVAAKALHG